MCTTRMYATLQPLRRHEQDVSSKKIYALYCNANLRLASTDTNVYYAHVRCGSAADLQPPRRHEQNVSSKNIYALYCNANLRLASTDSNVYYAHVRDAPGDLQPLRRHEQIVSPKKVYFANLRLAFH
jgi:hypothetical protein